MSLRKSWPLRVLFIAFYVLAGATAVRAVDCDSMTIDVLTASGGATVTGSAGAFSVDFGNVNGLGIGTPATGVSVTVSGTGATYTTPVTITFTHTSNCSGSAFDTRVYQDSTHTTASQTAAREGSAAASVVSVPTTLASSIIISTATGTTVTITRYVGIFVSNANGAGRVIDALSPMFIYKLTALNP